MGVEIKVPINIHSPQYNYIFPETDFIIFFVNKWILSSGKRSGFTSAVTFL